MAGGIEDLGNGILRIRAQNAGPLTGPGTNSYVVQGTTGTVVIDPGPEDAGHLANLRAAAGDTVRLILVTHAHLDHSAAAPALSRATGAPVAAYGDAGAGRSAAMARFVAGDPGGADWIGGGEGVDRSFRPDRNLADGAQVEGIVCLWTPGHFGNHMAFVRGGAAFTGDLAMGWASSLISPPDGDVGQYLASCERLCGCGLQVLYPGHGDAVDDPVGRLRALIDHRRAREAAILVALAGGPATPAALVSRLYRDVDAALHPAAARNVLAHLVDLADRGRITALPRFATTAAFRLRS